MNEPRGPERVARPRARPGSGRAGTDESHADGTVRERVQIRPYRYLIAPVPPQVLTPTIAPIDQASLIEQLDKDEDVRLIRTITSPQRGGGMEYPPIAVVEMAADHAAELATSPQIHIEADHHLRYGQASWPSPTRAPRRLPTRSP